MKSLVEQINGNSTQVNESAKLPKNNNMCPAQGPQGNVTILLGNPFTIDSYLAWKDAFAHAEHLCGRKYITIESRDVDSIKRDFEEDGYPLDETDELIYAWDAEREACYVTLFNDWKILLNK